jgi:uncharacterized membrane protein (GlpM family)
LGKTASQLRRKEKAFLGRSFLLNYDPIRAVFPGWRVLGHALMSVLAERGHPLLAGIVAIFPGITLVSFYFIGQAAGDDAVARTAKACLRSIPIWIPYALAIVWLSPRIDGDEQSVVSRRAYLHRAGVCARLHQSDHRRGAPLALFNYPLFNYYHRFKLFGCHYLIAK